MLRRPLLLVASVLLNKGRSADMQENKVSDLLVACSTTALLALWHHCPGRLGTLGGEYGEPFRYAGSDYCAVTAAGNDSGLQPEHQPYLCLGTVPEVGA